MYPLLDASTISGNAVESHSHFYHLDPLGIGTPFVESFGFYLYRLASEHNITLWDLIHWEILSRLYDPEDVSLHMGRWADWSSSIDNTTNTSCSWVQLIQELTLQDNLRALTTNEWPEIIARKRLVRKYEASCLLCIQEWRTQKIEPYIPLLWRINEVNCCPKHMVPLTQGCPYEDCRAQYLAFKVPVAIKGACPACNRQTDVENATGQAAPSQYDLWASAQVSELIMRTQQGYKSAPREEIYRSLRFVAERVTGQSLLVLSNKYFDLPDATLYMAAKANSNMRLETLLKVCFGLKVGLIDLLAGDIANSPLLNHDISESSSNRWVRHDRNRIEPKLKALLESETLITTNDVEQLLGCSKSYLREQFPEMWQEVVIRSRIVGNSRPRRAPTESERARVASVVAAALTRIPPPSPKDVYYQCGCSVDRFRNHFPNERRQLVERYQQWNSKTHGKNGPSKVFPKRELISSALDARLKDETSIPISVSSLVTQFDCSESYLRRHFRTKCREISIRFKKYRAGLKQQRIDNLSIELRHYMVELYDQGVYPGKSVINAKFDTAVLAPWFRKLHKEILIELRDRTSILLETNLHEDE